MLIKIEERKLLTMFTKRGIHVLPRHHDPNLIFFKKKVGKNGGKWGKMFNFVAYFI